MSEEKALTVAKQAPMELALWQIDKEFGEYAARAGMGNMYEAAVKAHVARELGVSAVAGLNGIHVIEGKPSIAPALAWAQILKHPEFDGYIENRLEDDKGNFYGWEITLKRKNGVQATRRFTMDDARRIVNSRTGKPLADKDNYKNYPENVCYWRAMGFSEDVVFADVTLGLKRADELGADITPEGFVVIEQEPEKPKPQLKPVVVEVKPKPELKPQPVVKVATLNNEPIPYVVEPAPVEEKPVVVPSTEDIPQYGFTLTKLLESVADTDVLEAFGGTFPTTDDEVNQTVHNLVKAGKLNVSDNPS